MAVRGLQYSQELEKQLAAGKSLKEAHTAAAKTRKVDTAKKKAKPNWVKRLKAKVRATFGAKQDIALKKRYLKYYGKLAPKKHTLTYVQWLKNQPESQ